MTEPDRKNVDLEAFFAAAARDDRQEPSPELMARILSDGESEQPAQTQAKIVDRNRGSIWAQFVAVIGGWPSLTGLAAATVVSVWVGFSASELMFTDGVSGLLSQNADGYLMLLDGENLFELEEL